MPEKKVLNTAILALDRNQTETNNDPGALRGLGSAGQS